MWVMSDPLPKCMREDGDLEMILRGCNILRPRMAKTWAAIGRLRMEKDPKKIQKHVITEKGDWEFIPNVILFSFDEGKRVPLIEELILKGWLNETEHSFINEYVVFFQWRKLFDFFAANAVGLVKDFVSKHPKALFSGALVWLLTDKEIPSVMEAVGDKLIHITKNDEERTFCGGMTALMCMIQLNRTPAALKSILHFGGTEQLIDAQDDYRRTAAHWCVAGRKYELLREAILPFSPNLELKDNFGSTALDMAAARRYTDIQVLLSGPTVESEGDTGLRNVVETKKGLLDFLPPLYESPGHVDASGKGHDPLIRYLEREFPDTLKKGSCLVVVPSSFPSECPYSEEVRVKGWKNEMLVYDMVKLSLPTLCKKYPNQKFFFFCGCRYSVTATDEQGNEKKLEREIDGVLLTHGDKSRGLFLEVKSGKSLRSVLRGMGQKQLENHVTFLEGKLNCDLSWVKKSLAVPEYSQPRPIHQKNGIVLLTKYSLQDEDNLIQWFEENLGLANDSSPRHEDDYIKLLVWALVATMGVVVPRIAEMVDDSATTAETVTALLTKVQFQILHFPHLLNVPMVIYGNFGTGKTFITEQKILYVHNRGEIGTGKKLVFITPRVKMAITAVLRRKLGHIEGVSFVIHLHDMDDVTTFLKALSPDVKFLIIDQFEHFLLTTHGNDTAVSNVWEIIKKLGRSMNPVWILVNPSELHSFEAFNGFQKLVSRDSERGQCTIIRLDATLRNSQSVCNFMERASMLRPLSAPRGGGFVKPCAVAGPPVTFTYYTHLCGPHHPFVEMECTEKLKCIASTTAQVLHGLITDKNIKSEEIIIVHTISPKVKAKAYKQLLMELDRHLVQEFQRVKKERLRSTAPVLVHSPMECLSEIYKRDFDTRRAVALLDGVQHSMVENSKNALEILFSSIRNHIEKGMSTVLDDVVAGILIRLLTLRESGEEVFNVLQNLKLAVEAGHVELKKFLDPYRFMGVHNWEYVDGYEANVVVAVETDDLTGIYGLVRSASRAKVMGTLVVHAEIDSIQKLQNPDLQNFQA